MALRFSSSPRACSIPTVHPFKICGNLTLKSASGEANAKCRRPIPRNGNRASGRRRSCCRPTGLTADVQLRRVGSEQTISTAQAVISQSDAPRRVAEADFQTDGLEPSLYSVKVQLREGIVDLGTITREIRIE